MWNSPLQHLEPARSLAVSQYKQASSCFFDLSFWPTQLHLLNVLLSSFFFPLPTPDVKSHCCTATSILFPIFLTFTSDSPSCRLIFQHEICGIGRYFKLSCVMAGCTRVTVLTIRVGATEESVGSLDELSSHHRCYVEKKSRWAAKPELFGRELCVMSQ